MKRLALNNSLLLDNCWVIIVTMSMLALRLLVRRKLSL